ncbi:Nuclear factor NF-kappa-B p110 subunit [Amphibalanus amphitrite]|uniref:Nuclear factor NF-kappa-B p110 subunit n=1 Tax=Amphibalanus amphitrite TaxID=1232801 RepID=A0A6A4VPA8_AMPAM|nr:Nuclear factor NF-kappa-B p110 subunit [Amphibalanus amphitrite]
MDVPHITPLTGLHMGGPQLKIVEQPQERFRFRYESELGGTHGQLAGRSGADRRSFPTVKLDGFNHRATIRCELFTVEEGASNLPPVPHVHTLQGRNCTGGYAEMRVDQENDFTASFQGLGIIHTAKKQMVEKITNRKLDEKKMEMERMNMGKLWNPTEADRQEARDQANRESQRINMNRVCLRFRALYQNPGTMRMEEICQPIFSDAIYNGKSAQTGELKIVQLSEAHSPCTGNKEIWLLVERVRKNDIKVLVFEEDSSHQTIWQDYGRVIKCHHQYAIIFQTPPYRDKEIRSPVRVFIQLERPSDGCVSEPKHFQYTERDQRTTKRMLMPAESGGPSDSKRFYFDSEQGKEPWPSLEPEPRYLPQRGLPPPGREPYLGRYSPDGSRYSPQRRYVSPERRYTPVDYAAAASAASGRLYIPTVVNAQSMLGIPPQYDPRAAAAAAENLATLAEHAERAQRAEAQRA